MSIDDQRDLPTKGSGATTTGTEDRGCRIADRESSRGDGLAVRPRFDRAKHALSKAEGNPKFITKNIRTLRVLPELRGKN
jgi:hypothetical protein